MVKNIVFAGAVISLWLLAIYPADCPAEERVFTKTVSLTGETVIPAGEAYRVGPGAVLTVDGTMIVKGKLILQGDDRFPATLVMKNSSGYGMVIRGGEFVGTNFALAGSRRGIESYSGVVRMFRGKSSFPGIHLNVSGVSKLTVGEVEFEGGKVGIVFRTGSGGSVEKSEFSGQKRAGIYVYGTGGLEVRNCTFSGAEAGAVLSLYGAEALFQKNIFDGNGEGIRVQKFAEPEIRGNSFYRNRTGIIFSKRGRGEVRGNVFKDNRVSIHVKYSSYPLVRGNDFLEYGEYAVMLENQSSEWEEKATDADREESILPFPGPGGGKRSRPIPGKEELRLPEESLTGRIDFRENYWGGLTDEMKEKGPDGNMSGIYDGRDREEFTFEGKKYRMDRVDIHDPRFQPQVEGGR